jgi:hypothetical protein
MKKEGRQGQIKRYIQTIIEIKTIRAECSQPVCLTFLISEWSVAYVCQITP